ncbi:MAG: universal stress protein [Candidatus Marinimicrobia bacterium]|nr:universal stress protein [Candidatus Neomarinimicrobiota bacterium]MBT3943948.1 universal stress protein [Candidatus Neomarinimicrobiota bacterium]MBT4706707.1 universal stress protein [Candidatus Neomarinimicrobiota bacterium]MBT4925674.1 universal stress protein [Candidatus Neomarinimicrobiota bacterium]MBT5251736.1 universal stress protein [Candidatus Neomarinimicrobiota bacterium]
MNILIAIGGKEYSKPTLDLGMKIANAFEATTTIAYVGKRISQFSEKDVSVVHQNLDSRELYRPGVRTLEWAYDFLESKKYIKKDKSIAFNDHLLIDEENSRMRVLLKGSHSNKIDLILRTGEIIDQLRSEVATSNHDITIIGGGGNKGMHHKLVQFIDSSVMVVKNYSVNKQYKILLPVNNSTGSNKAIQIAEKFAKSKKLPVEIITVLENKSSDEKLRIILEKTEQRFTNAGIKNTATILEGNPVKTVVKYAKDDSLVMLGVSPKNPFLKYFFGSKPISIAQQCNCPVLIAK